ncbi:MAG: hypothetical protein AB7I19_08505 [Planctomycetota bacterium]
MNESRAILGVAERSWLVLAVLLAAVVALLSPALFDGAVLAQLDSLHAYQPWRSLGMSVTPQNHLLLDQSIVMLPWNDFCAASVRAGELPLWSPYNYAGMPLVGACQSAIYWPLNWIFYAAPSLATYEWIASLRLLLTGTFALLFLRRIGLAPLAAGVGAIAFMLSGFQVAWLQHPHANVGMMLPALAWAVERAVATGRGRDHALFAVFVGLQLVAGHVQTSMHVSLFIAGWIAFRMLAPLGGRRIDLRMFRSLAVSGVLGAMLAAPQLWPVAEYVAHSQATSQLARADLTASVEASSAAKFLWSADHYGSPVRGDYRGPLGHNLNYSELVGGHVGKLALGLALLGALSFLAARGRRAPLAFFAAATLLATAVAWQVDPFYGLARAIPGFAQTKLLRLLLLTAFGLAVLAAFGMEWILTRLRSTRARAVFGAVAMLAVASELVVQWRGYNPAVDPKVCVPPTPLTDFLRAQGTEYRALAVDNSVLAPNANLFYRVPMLAGYDSVEYRNVTELLLAATTRRPDFDFVARIGAFDNEAALPLLSLLGAKWILFDGPLPLPVAAATTPKVYRNDRAMPKAFLARALDVVPDGSARVARISRSDFDPHQVLLGAESDSSRRWREARTAAAASPGKAELSRYEPRSIEVELQIERPELLVVNDAWAPGWHAEVTTADGTREATVELVDHALRGIWLEPGDRRLTLRYRPLSTYGGLALAGIAALILLVWSLRRRRSHSRETEVGSPPAADLS